MILDFMLLITHVLLSHLEYFRSFISACIAYKCFRPSINVLNAYKCYISLINPFEDL